MTAQQQEGGWSRRDFLSRSAAGATALAGFSVPRYGYGKNEDRIRVGVVGCGGRGTGACRDVLQAGPNIELVAMADIHQMQIEKSIERLQRYKTKDKKLLEGIRVTPDQCFTGLDGYKKVIDSDIDYVLLCTPPGFRPEHIAYAVQAGKHIFAEKPCATDPPGVRRILALEKEIDRKGIGLLAGFNSRHSWHRQEAVRRLQDGALGEIISLHAYFNTGNIWYRDREPGMSERDYWFYNWFHVDWLCGDHIVEQHVHNLDRCNWIMDAHPVQAYGMGGRQYHTERGGNIYDHFAVEFEYPNGVRMTSMCRQIAPTDRRIGEVVYCTEGQASMLNNAPITFTGKQSWKRDTDEGQAESHMQEHIDFITDLRNGKITNDTRILCDGTLTAILGRESAYTGQVVQWDDLAQSDLRLVPEDIASWDGSMRPVWKPGMERV